MAVTFSINVTLPVFKALTAKLDEGQTHDDVLRELLAIDSIIEPEPERVEHALSAFQDEFAKAFHEQSGKGGFFSRGLWLPNETQLRARYKGREFRATIVDNQWLDEKHRVQTSPSGAATKITGTNVNGLRFWEAKRPGDATWRRLDVIVQP
jgi:hypothetical protein